ncbi:MULTISPECIES: GNAT family N-acetyltransferase [Agrobacterium]|uniref:GNAT family N-acetyltransferase n=1 Tax=Agrobacterium tumefaciens TaxID=358 RepID=A0AAF0H3N3_AGRTU|nr:MULTISPECIES: GNAT family N-acetyltransferase [Agrobacterium]WGM61755.1 GNAT family N-acetyltransferase [Agrobacterium tumefaciens]CVI64250.1 GCN5-related N-acetyltransferase [Agrobacterium salinitolerans str. Hayward 0363]
MVSVNFRQAFATDHASITDLHVRVSSEAYADMLPQDYLANVMPGEKAKLWQRRLAPSVNPERLVITLAEVHSGLAGFACFVLDEETNFGTYLHNLYVDRSFQGKRLGLRLLIESISRFSEERWEEPVHLLTMRENYPARGFYDRLNGHVVEQKQNVMSRYPDVTFVRYQWPSARAMAANASNLGIPLREEDGR